MPVLEERQGGVPGISPMARWRRLVCMGVCLLTGMAQAHDTWFQVLRPEATAAPVRRVLGTGDRFPLYDAPVLPEHLARHACRADQGPVVATVGRSESPTTLALEPTVALPATALRTSCWAQLHPLDIDLDDRIVELYFKEAQPPQSVRQAWDAQRARSERWRERYTKHARVETFGPSTGTGPATEAAVPEPSGMDMDALLLSPRRLPVVGDTLEFQVLSHGQPMAGFSVEFQVHGSRFGIWRRTDAQGRVRLPAAVPGRWLLRGIELTPPTGAEGLWTGRFITLAFDVAPAAR